MRAILRLGLALAMRFITGSEYERISYYPRGDPVSLTIQSLYNVYIYGMLGWPRDGHLITCALYGGK